MILLILFGDWMCEILCYLLFFFENIVFFELCVIFWIMCYFLNYVIIWVNLIVYFLKLVFLDNGLVVFNVRLFINCVVLKNGMYISFCGGWLWLWVFISEIILLWCEIIFILLLCCKLWVLVFNGWMKSIVLGKVWCNLGIWWVMELVC